MKLVIIESPFSGDTDEEINRNLAYARAAMADALSRNEAPFASHLLYTQVLDDAEPAQRKLGMDAGFHWANYASAICVYEDLGISKGMMKGIGLARSRGRTVEYRKIEGWEE